MGRRSVLLAAAFLAAGLAAALPEPALAGPGHIRVTVRNEFGTNLTGATLIYSCGSGEQRVTDDDGLDQDATDGVILITPAAAASCNIADDLVVRVQNLDAAGYLHWIDESRFYDTNSENSYVATMPFSVLVRLTDQFGATFLTASDAAGIFVGGATVNGVLSPDHTKLGFPVPVGGADGSLTVTGLGPIGYLNTTTQNIVVPVAGDSRQRVYNSRNQYSILVLGRDQFGLELLGSGGSALFQSGAQIACSPQTGTSVFGCPIPVGSAASTVRVARPGFVNFSTVPIAPPSAATDAQTAVQTANLFAIRVLGVADEFGDDVTPTSTPDIDPPFLASGTEILGMRWADDEWYIAATPGSAQLTVRVNGYLDTTVGVDIGTAAQAVVDYDGPSGATWNASTDGPAVVQAPVPRGGLFYAAGTLLKLSCPSDAGPFDRCRAVYHYGGDGNRHPFPNDKVYRSWYADFSNILTVSESAMAAVPLGVNVRYRPGVRLLKVASAPDVYALERGTLRTVLGETTAVALYGSGWATQVDDINDIFFGDYARGADITEPSAYSPTAARDGTATIEQEFGR